MEIENKVFAILMLAIFSIFAILVYLQLIVNHYNKQLDNNIGKIEYRIKELRLEIRKTERLIRKMRTRKD